MADLSKLASFPSFRMCRIGHRELTENSATIRLQRREIRGKTREGGQKIAPQHYCCRDLQSCPRHDSCSPVLCSCISLSASLHWTADRSWLPAAQYPLTSSSTKVQRKKSTRWMKVLYRAEVSWAVAHHLIYLNSFKNSRYLFKKEQRLARKVFTIPLASRSSGQ